MEIINVAHQLNLFLKVLCVFGVFSLSTAQELQLKIISKDSIETDIINSIGYPKTFDNFDDLQTEVSLFKDQLYIRGYIEAQLLEISQTPPLLFAKLSLGPKYESIQLYANKSVFELLEMDGVKDLESTPYYKAEIITLKPLLNSLTEFLTII